MAVQRASEASILVGSETFRQGVARGLRGQDGRFDLTGPYVDEPTIIAIVENLCQLARAGELTTARIVHDSGLLTGYIAARLDRR